jgi:serine phosphatase RsbU (regulator of sigma subunit)
MKRTLFTLVSKSFLGLFFCLSVGLGFSQSKSRIILKKANELFSKNYAASFDMCCQAEKINDLRFIGEVSMCKARYYITFSDYENGEIELSKAISFYKKRRDFINLSDAYDLKSTLLGRIGDTTGANSFLVNAYLLSKKYKDIHSEAKRLINLSNNCNEQNQLDKARYYLDELEKLAPKVDSSTVYYLYQNRGAYFIKKQLYNQGIFNYQKAYKLAKKEKMVDSQATILMLLSHAHRQKNELKESEKYAMLSYYISDKYKLIYEKSEAIIELINIKEALKDFSSAFLYQKEYIKVEKEILNSEKLNRISAIQNRLVLAEKENIINRQNSKIAKEKLKNSESEIRHQKLYIFVIILLISFGFFVFIYFRTKKLTETIRLKKTEVEEKNKLVESQNKDITDSIRYAERIQQAIMPPAEKWLQKLPNSFVLHAPKDILSGDFCWMEEIDDVLLIAAADCTGHGVPGALISIVNFNLLNKAILEKQIFQPHLILDAVNDWLTDSLHQSYASSAVKDGMDISLISINKNTFELNFSGAFNSIYILRNSEIIEIKGDKFPVGAFIHDEKQHFHSVSFSLQKGDQIYLFTDGFADQFGGPKEKKFKYTQLKAELIKNQHLSSIQQKVSLERSFNDWKGSLDQVDDVLIIGIKI